jgi:crossover junction endodeoxyribonuclease RusA
LTVVEIPLPWPTPPLSLNHRRNRWAHARKVKEVREAAGWLAKSHNLGGPWPHVTVTLHYRPAQLRVIDLDNHFPTIKALCDGLVDAGVVTDDAPAYMTKNLPVVHPPKPPSRLWLVVEVTDPAAAEGKAS